ncbi:MAG: F0F1 ATP synthase subunit B [Bifidobacteriaceae bacterium]|jgi:F-type H+-transporting ATPase subunit b|nr:F0F1 ATP synthase subunit B [Bifidobacteriaceae bacterium]
MITAAGAPAGIGLFIPPLYDIVLSVACLAVIAFVVVKKVVPTYLTVLDERTAKIEGGLRKAAEAEAQIAEERALAAAQLEQAAADAARAKQEARQDAEAIVADARRKASAEAERLLAAAQAQIAADTKAAEVALRADIGSLATELAERIVGEALTDSALAGRVVDRFLDELSSGVAPTGGERP